MRKIAGYLTKNRSEKDQKIAQSTHENGYIKPRKTFWRNSKQLLRYVNNFHEIISTESLLLMKHNERPHYLIMVSPAMDGFILKCADEVQLKPEDYGFPSDLKAFTTFTKSVTSKNASEFKKLFKDLRNASELKTLRGWLEYLRTNQYKSKEEDLQSMVSR